MLHTCDNLLEIYELFAVALPLELHDRMLEFRAVAFDAMRKHKYLRREDSVGGRMTD